MCIIVISELDSENNKAAETLIKKLISVNVNSENIVSSHIELLYRGKNITIELPVKN